MQTFVYVFIDICIQWSKWLGPNDILIILALNESALSEDPFCIKHECWPHFLKLRSVINAPFKKLEKNRGDQLKKMLFDLTEKVCLVTGASRGIGLALVQALLKHGTYCLMVDVDYKVQFCIFLANWHRVNTNVILY